MHKDRIKDIINHYKINQTTFAEKASMSKAYLSEILNGKVKSLSADKVKIICEKFNVNSEWFLFGTGDIFKAKTIKKIDLKFENHEELEEIIKLIESKSKKGGELSFELTINDRSIN